MTEKMEKMENNDVCMATDVVASQLPERRPTGTPHARANCVLGQSSHYSVM